MILKKLPLIGRLFGGGNAGVFTALYLSLYGRNLNLEVELIYEWEVGSMLIFDRTHLHCSSSVIEGKKIGLATFTKK